MKKETEPKYLSKQAAHESQQGQQIPEKIFLGGRRMGKKHYSGKELIYRRRMEKQRQQGRENTIRKRVHDMNQLKKSVEATRQDMLQRARERKEKAAGAFHGADGGSC